MEAGMTEFEEITLKKIIKSKMVDEFYINLNVLLESNHIKNKELSGKIGWDSAGYNQKLNRKSDLKISTLITVIMAIMDLMDEKNQTNFSFYEKFDSMDLTRLFSMSQFRLGELFLNVSDTVSGGSGFLGRPELVKTYRSLKPFVVSKRQSPRLSDKEIEVYMKFYDMAENSL